jgi:hypothetical protein
MVEWFQGQNDLPFQVMPLYNCSLECDPNQEGENQINHYFYDLRNSFNFTKFTQKAHINYAHLHKMVGHKTNPLRKPMVYEVFQKDGFETQLDLQCYFT